MKYKLVASLALFAFVTQGLAQTEKKILGTWEGKLNVGVELRIVFHIKENGAGGLLSTADSPDQSAFGMKCDTTFLAGENVTIEMHKVSASFTGKLIDDSTIEGTFTQTAKVSLRLKKGESKEPPRKRPQTPQSPYPYKSEEVGYDNSNKSLHFGATITIPSGNGPFPAAVLITGSGPQNRDEEILGHHPFAVLADALTRKGMVVLRVDDRGVGKSTGDFTAATSADFAEDVNTSINYLISRPEVEKNKVGLIGHSEGGMIAPMVANQRKDINFIILLAGPGIKIIDLMTEQNMAVLRSLGISQPSLDVYAPFYKQLITVMADNTDTAASRIKATSIFEKWLAETKEPVIRELGFESKKDQQEFIRDIVTGFSGKWFKYFLAFDPTPYLQKLNCKVLAINGDKDIQVIATSNLAGITAALKQSKVKNPEIKALPGLNHLFQQCKKCTVQEYGELEETFSPTALQIITDWFEKNVK